MDVNLNISALEKLLDYAASGIGSIAGPMLVSWRARREGEASRIAAHAEADVQAIRAAGQAESLSIITAAQEDARQLLTAPGIAIRGEFTIAEAIEQRVQFQEQKRQSNIGAIVQQAALEVGDKQAQDHEVDHDWTARFFTEIQDVSSEEMQSLWAKVLAGEVERPRRTSIRTLDILRGLDQRTANLFRKLCSACVSINPDGSHFIDARVPSLGGNAGENVLQQYGLNFGNLNVLNEHGLVISDYNSWFDYRIVIGINPGPGQPPPRIPFCFQNRQWVLVQTNQRDLPKEFRMSGVALTRSGQELSRIVDLEPMDEYAQALREFFEGRHLRMIEASSG